MTGTFPLPAFKEVDGERVFCPKCAAVWLALIAVGLFLLWRWKYV